MLKTKIYRIVEKGSHGSRFNLIFDYSIMSLIILNLIAIILDTVSSIHTTFQPVFRIFEIFSISVFSIEYLMRIYVADLTHPSTSKFRSILKFMFSVYGLIDLMAILPFYLPFLIKVDLRFLRILRLIRFVRIFKFNRYNNSLNLIWSVIKDKKTELTTTGFMAMLVIVIAAILMYYVEGEKQPQAFPNILASFWWAIATLTTIGYGDIVPITPLGKLLSGIIALLGVGLVALPTGLISAGLIEKINKRKQKAIKCPHCGKEIRLDQEEKPNQDSFKKIN